jgi:peroxiredoxin
MVAPDFSLTAVATKRVFKLSAYRGRAVVLVFVDINSARQSREIVVELRRRYPEFARLAIAVVVDLRLVPSLLRGMAEGIMVTAYRGAAAEVPSGHDPAEHLILLQDWDGKVSRAYAAGDVSRRVRLVVIDADGRVRASESPADAAAAALDIVSGLLDAT